jgi:WD40 repeat protein
MIAVSPDGCLAAAAHVASELADPTSTVTVWDSATGGVAASISVTSSIDGISFCSASERLITRAGDGTITVWRARGGDRVATFCCGPPGRGSMACSPVGSLIAACVAAGDNIHSVLVAVSDVSHGDRHWDTSIALRSDAAAFHRPRLAFSGDGQFLACGTADAVTLFNASDGRILAEVDAAWHRISALQFATDGHSVASAGQDGTVRWWSLPDLNELQRNEDLLLD